MSAISRTGVARMATALLAIVGFVIAGVFISPSARADDASTTGASITIEPSDGTTSLQGRAFEAWMPIKITGYDANKIGVSVDIRDQYLKYVTDAAASAGLTTSDGARITASSSQEDVIDAISNLAEHQTSPTDDPDARSFAQELRDQLKKGNVAPDYGDAKFASMSDGSRKLNGLDYGWYLVDETTLDDSAKPSGTSNNSPVSLVMTTPVTGPAVIKVKSKTPESHKNIVDEDGTNQRKAAIVNQNEPIHFQLTFHVPAEWSSQFNDGFWFTMNDTLDPYLHFDKVESVKVGNAFGKTDGDQEFSQANGQYDFNMDPSTSTAGGKTTLTWAFGDSTGKDPTNNLANKSLAGKWVKLYYQARLSNGAPFNTAIGNAYDVTYQHSPYTVQGGEKTPTEHPYVYTYNLALRKIDGADADKYLSGAQFQMYTDQACKHTVKFTQVGGTYEHDPNGTVMALTTDSDGKINIAGIAGSVNGTHYYLKEIKAPAGYRLNSAVIDVNAKVPDFKDQAENARTDGAVQTLTYNLYAQGGYSSVDGNLLVIKNFRGYLPSTGARGIVLTSIAGLLLIGVGMLMMRRKQ